MATRSQARGGQRQAFQLAGLKGLALTIGAGGAGLTLTTASNMLMVDLDWTPANNSQAMDRICRIGQAAAHIQCIRMTSSHALDRHIQRLLIAKQVMIEAAVNASVQVIRLVKAPSPSAPEVVEETEEELEARIKATHEELAAKQAAAQRAALSSRVDDILAGESRKASRPELPLTSERREAIKASYAHMLGICDGAVTRDHVGFNKPDASRARDLLRYDLDSDDRAMRAAERMLTRYHRQLSPLFPALFEG
jgi:hypothetical protein